MRKIRQFLCVLLAVALVVGNANYAFADNSDGTSVVTDTCSSLDYVYNYSDVTMIDIQSSNANYIGDDWRIRRLSTMDEYFDYRTSASISQVEIISYYHPSHTAISFNPFTFYTSSDGETWNVISATHSQEANSAGTDWLKYRFSITDLPANVSYLRIQFPTGYPDSWAPQIGNVAITVNSSNGTFIAAAAASLDALDEAIQEYTEAIQQVATGSNVGDVIPEAKEEFLKYIAAAQASLESFNQETKARDVLLVQAELEAAYDHFLTQIHVTGDSLELQSAIAQAKGLLSNATEGSSVGAYAVGAKSDLSNAIATAEGVLLQENSLTQSAVCDAVNELRTAMSVFGAKKNTPSSYESVFTNYIVRDGDTLKNGNSDFKFISANIASTYGLQYPSWNNSVVMRPVTEYEQEDLIKTIKELGGQVARTYVFPIQGGSCTDEEGSVYLLSSTGEYSEEEFLVIDRLLALANEHGVRLIIPFIDTWEHHGGIPQFAAIYGKTAEEFYTDREVIEGFKSYIRTILTRVNSITGVPYYEDKAILAWETGNELSAPEAWTDEIAAFIKSIDPNHLVMDGYYGVADSSLINPNVDIVSNHYYNATSTSDFANRFLRNAWRANGRKAFIVGEYGLSNNATEMALMDAVVSEGTAGCLIWCLYGHSEDGGFYNSGDLHWPGKNSDDVALMSYLREKAYAVQGSAAPAISVPEAPVLKPIETQLEIAWQGSVGAASYKLERSTAENGTYEVIATNLTEGIGAAYAPAEDTSAVVGTTYYYRMIACNSAGDSVPSNVVSFTVTHTVDVRNLLRLIDSAEQLLDVSNEADYDSGAFVFLQRAITTARNEINARGAAPTESSVKKAEIALTRAIDEFNESKLTANKTILFDDFNDLSKVHSQSNIVVETGDGNGVFLSDNPRVKRETTEDGVLVYYTESSMVELCVEGYLWPNRAYTSFVSFYTSSDGSTYTELDNVEYVVKDNLSGQWKSVTYSSSNLPDNTHYLKIVLSNSNERYNPELDFVRIYGSHYPTAGTLYTDDFANDLSNTTDSNNVVVHAANNVHPNFGKYLQFASNNSGDTGIATGYVVYDVYDFVQNGTLEELTVWYSPDNNNSYKTLEVSFSADGVNYTTVSTVNTQVQTRNWVGGNASRWQVVEQAVSEIPENTRYVKLSISTSKPTALYSAHILLVDFWISASAE